MRQPTDALKTSAMNRTRLEKLRDTLRKLRPAVPADAKNAARTLTQEATLCANAANLPAIDTFDFTTFHATGGPGGGAAGCIAGVAIQLFPEAAASELDKAARDPLQYDIGRSTADIVAQHVLGLDDRQGDQLLCAADETRTDENKPVTPEEAAVAVERLLAGENAERIWDHLCPEDDDDEPEEETAREFLDHRDEARISHRLGQPFRF